MCKSRPWTSARHCHKKRDWQTWKKSWKQTSAARPRKRLRENARKKSVSRRKLRSRQSVRQKKRNAKLQKLRKHRKPPRKSNRQNLSLKWVR